MNTVGEREIRTQERVIAFFRDALGYTYLGNWQDNSEENSNILPEDLADWLRRQGYDNDIIAKALDQLQRVQQSVGREDFMKRTVMSTNDFATV